MALRKNFSQNIRIFGKKALYIEIAISRAMG